MVAHEWGIQRALSGAATLLNGLSEVSGLHLIWDKSGGLESSAQLQLACTASAGVSGCSAKSNCTQNCLRGIWQVYGLWNEDLLVAEYGCVMALDHEFVSYVTMQILHLAFTTIMPPRSSSYILLRPLYMSHHMLLRPLCMSHHMHRPGT